MRFPIRLFAKPPSIRFSAAALPATIITLCLMLATGYLLMSKGLNYGIDFAGGVVMEIKTDKPADLSKMRALLADSDIGNASLQHVDSDHQVLLRIKPEAGQNQSQVAGEVKALFSENYADHISYERVDYVGAQVGSEMITASIMALGFGMLAIMGYLWIRFEWQFGVGGILAMFHDAFLTLGFYAATGIEFNLTSVAALLTIIGYSINDSVVIYDRIRENMRKYKKLEMAQLINRSVNETLARTIITSGTLLLALGGLIFYGGQALFGFSVAMFFGAVVGTYSSIFVSAILLLWLNPRHHSGTQKQPA
jgi:preprotein translocase SecF subunit